MLRLKSLVVAIALTASCVKPLPPVTPPPPPPPPPPAANTVVWCVEDRASNPLVGVILSATSATEASWQATTGQTGCVQTTLGSATYDVTFTLSTLPGRLVPQGGNVLTAYISSPGVITQAVSFLPPPIARMDALLVKSHDMQGMTVTTSQYGAEPYWGASLAWHTVAADRQAIYAAKLALGDTHAIITVPVGDPLYNEGGQFYSPDKFGALDWCAALTACDHRLADLVVEVRQAGLRPILFPPEDYPRSLTATQLFLSALQNSPYGDIRDQVAIYMTGWDGVFYNGGGWPNVQTTLPGWATTIRGICPACNLGMEFGTGYIPQEGGIDMSGFDAEFIEFEVAAVHNWNNWQVVSRLIGENAYHKPSDDTSPHPVPMVNMNTPRGEIVTICFEVGTYAMVRGNYPPALAAPDLSYLWAEGCPGVD